MSWFVLNFFYWPKKIAQNVLHFSNALLSNYQIYQAEQLYLCSIQKYTNIHHRNISVYPPSGGATLLALDQDWSTAVWSFLLRLGVRLQRADTGGMMMLMIMLMMLMTVTR